MKKTIVLIFSLAMPLLLLPIEHLLPYPYILEELLKLCAVLVLTAGTYTEQKNVIVYVILSGLIFSLSESIFYLVNFFVLQNFGLVLTRLLMTSLLHIFTFVLIYLSGKKTRYGYVAGLAIAMLIHYWYNVFVTSYF